MSGIRWATSCREFSLEIGCNPMRQMQAICDRAESAETGGILIGYYTPDLTTLVVTEASPPPPDSCHSYSWFERGVIGLRKRLLRRWRAEPRTYYVGEWHHHPTSDVLPSKLDFDEMNQIGQTSSYRCSAPVLVIIGKANPVRNIRAWVFPRDRPCIEFNGES